MSDGPITRLRLGSADVMAPGEVGLSGRQISNTQYAVRATLPTKDADDSDLTELKTLTLGIVQVNDDGTDPTEGMDTIGVRNVCGPNIIDLPVTAADAGTDKDANLPVVKLGRDHIAVAWASD